MGDELEAIVQQMIDAGEPEESIAAVIREYQPSAPEGEIPTATATTGLALGAMKAAPGIMSGVNAAAKGMGKLAKTKAARITPAIVAVDSAGRAMRGDFKGAATTAAGGAALSQAPKAVAALAKATMPSKALNTGSQFVKATSKAGPMMRGAGVLSKLAGMAALPATLLSSFSDLQTLRDQLEAEVAARQPEVLEQREYFGGF